MSDLLLASDDPLASPLEAALENGRLHVEIDGALRSWLGPHGRLGEIFIERIKYKPGEKAILSLRTSVDLEDRTNRETRIALRIFPEGVAASRFQKAQDQHLQPPIFGPPVFYLASLNAVGWSFPNDRKLATLAALSAPAVLNGEVIPAVAHAVDPEARICSSAIEIMHYVPEQACTVRLDLNLEHNGADIRAHRLFGKVHYDDTGARTFDVMNALSCALGQTTPDLGLACPLLYHANHRLLWQQSVSGSSLLPEQFFTGDTSLLRRAAAALAALHHIQLPAIPERRPISLLDRLDERMKVTRSLQAPLQSSVAAILRRLRTAPPYEAGMVTLHGDLHPQNMFDDGQRLYLIDFDAATRGMAELDLGSLFAALIYHGALLGIANDTIADRLDMLARSYEERSSRLLDRIALAWATSFCLLNERLYRCLTRLKPGRAAIVTHLISWADALSDNTAKWRAIGKPLTRSGLR